MTDAQKRALALAKARQALALAEAEQQQRQAATPSGADARNPDGTYGAPPEGMIANPYTGQMTERSLLAANVGPVSGGQAFARGGVQGLSFNFGDELQGRVDAMSQEGGTSDERYAFGRERARAMNETAQEQRPGAYLAGEIGGGVVAAGASAPLTFGAATLGQAAVRGGAIGAAEGVAYGMGRGENLDDRLGNALTDGALGAGLGIAAPYAIAGVKAATDVPRNAISGMVRAATGTASRRRAGEVLDRTVRRSGLSITDVQSEIDAAAAAGQTGYRMMDALGTPGADKVRGLARAGGESADELRDFLAERQFNQRDRVAEIASDAYMPSDTATARQLRGDLFDARRVEADTLYDTARQLSGAVNLTPAIDVIDDLMGVNPLLDTQTDLAQSAIGRRLTGLRGQMQAGGEQLIDFGEVLQVKSDLYNQMQLMKRSGASVPPQMSAVFRQLDQALEGASDGYRAANDSFRAASARIDAVELGQGFRTQRAADSIDDFRALAPDAQAGARAGYGDSIMKPIEGRKGAFGDVTSEVTGSIRDRELANELANDPSLLREKLGRESEMFANFNAGMGNSSTAQNLAAMEELAGQTQSQFLEAARELLNFQAGNALMRGARSVVPVATGVSQETRKLIADALMSSNPQVMLGNLLQQSTNPVRRSIEAAVRSIVSQQSRGDEGPTRNNALQAPPPTGQNALRQ